MGRGLRGFRLCSRSLFTTLALVAGQLVVVAGLHAPPAAADGALPIAGTGLATNGEVDTTAMSGNTLYLGGNFSAVGSYTGGAVFMDSTGQVQPGLPKINGVVRAAVSDANGGWYIGGDFLSPGTRLIHVDSNGTVDPTFVPNPDGYITSLALSGGYLYVVGGFITIGGRSLRFAARVNPSTGAADTWSPNPEIPPMGLTLSGTKLYMFGSFTVLFNTSSRIHLAAFDVSTDPPTLDPWNPRAFDPGAGSLFNSWVSALVVSGSTVYIGGNFTEINDSQPTDLRKNLAALDAADGLTTGQTPQAWNPTASGTVTALAVAGGEVYAGGFFFTLEGTVNRAHLAAIADDPTNATPAIDTSWDPSPDNGVIAITVSGTTVYVGGYFQSIGGSSVNDFAAVQAADGSSTGTALSFAPNPDDAPNFIIPTTGSDIFVGGFFTLLHATLRNHAAAIDLTTNTVTSFDPEPDATVDAITVSNGVAYLGGDFTNIGSQPRGYIAAVDATTGAPTDWDPEADNTVQSLLVDGTTVYAGGRFANIGGAARGYLAALDATVNTNNATTWDPEPNGSVTTMALSGSTLYIGGAFTSIGSVGPVSRGYLAAIPTTSPTPTSWDPELDNQPAAILVNGTAVYVGGYFSAVDGVSKPYLAAIDATATTTGSYLLPWAPAPDAYVASIALSGNRLYAGGNFNNIGGAARSDLAVLDTTTGVATPFTASLGGDSPSVDSVALSSKYFVAGGQFAGNLATFSLPQISIDDVSVPEGNSGPTPAEFTVSLDQAALDSVGVDVATSDGSAKTSDGDYTSHTEHVTFAPGETVKHLDVSLNGDTKDEPDETFHVNLSNAAGANIVRGTGLGTIANDDSPPSLSITPLVKLREGNRGTKPFTFTVALSAPSGKTITVHYATADGSAHTPKDYIAIPDTVMTFNPGDPLTQTITVLVKGDRRVERNETFFVNLTAPTNATLPTSPTQGKGIIKNDDS